MGTLQNNATQYNHYHLCHSANHCKKSKCPKRKQQSKKAREKRLLVLKREQLLKPKRETCSISNGTAWIKANCQSQAKMTEAEEATLPQVTSGSVLNTDAGEGETDVRKWSQKDESKFNLWHRGTFCIVCIRCLYACTSTKVYIFVYTWKSVLSKYPRRCANVWTPNIQIWI